MEEKERISLKKKLTFLGLSVFLIFSLLVSRLWSLQIAKGSEYTAKAKGNTLRWVTIPAPRGDIRDRNGKVLATSVPQFAITLDWLDLQNAKGTDPKNIVGTLSKYVQPYWANGKATVDSITEDILAKIQMHQFRRYEPVVIMENIPLTLQAVLAEHQQELPGIAVEARPYRSYPLGPVAGHLLGYVREVSEGELPIFQERAVQAGKQATSYQSGDLVGKMGIENSYDLYLRGQEGLQLMEVDTTARPVDRLTRQDPVVGKSVQLTIDADLQKVVGDKLKEVIDGLKKKGKAKAGAGAAVVIEVKTGRILAMVSEPEMNPNELTGDISNETFTRYFGTKAEGSPRLGWNRADQEIYAPGSTFKMITAMAALQDGKIGPNDTILDSLSSLSHPNAAVGDWNSWSFGRVNLSTAMAQSINYYFEALGERVMSQNPERLAQVAREFGLGRKTGIDIPGEVDGVAPSAEWKKNLNGPRYEKLRDDRLAKLQQDTDQKLAQAANDQEKKNVQAEAYRQKQQILFEFNESYKWYAGWQAFDTYNMSIGQGDNRYSPLQMANYVATIVNGGHRMQPYLVDKVIDTNTGSLILENKPVELNQVSISPANLAYVKQAMRAVFTSGTGASIFRDIPQFSGGGKTGTAQIGSRGTPEEDDYNGTFVAFAPYDNPEIAFAGVVEYGFHGAESTSQIARAAFLQYFRDRGWAEKK